MKLTEDDISAFIEAWQCAFDETLSRDRAEAEANRLMHFYITLVDVPVDVTGLLPTDHDTISA